MTSRDAILAAVRANEPAPAPALPDVPRFESTTRSLLDEFREALLRMGGKFAPKERAAETLTGSSGRSFRRRG